MSNLTEGDSTRSLPPQIGAIAGALNFAQSTIMPAFVISFIAAVVLSFLIYGKFLKYVAARPDLEERFGLLKK